MAKAKNTAAQIQLFKKPAIPKMSEGYYSGDKPNPNLRKFVEEYVKERPYDPATDNYDVPPLMRSSKTKRSTKVFNMHTYWSKKPHDAIQEYVTHYTKLGDLVLDPFCGSGGSILVANMTGRNGVGIDLSPAATFLSSSLCAPPPRQEFAQAFQSIMASLRREYAWIYQYPYKGKTLPIHFGISSMKFQCLKCLVTTSFYRCTTRRGETCCPSCSEVIRTNQEKFGYQLDEWHLYLRQGKHHIVSVDGKRSQFEDGIQARVQEELKQHPAPKFDFPPQGRTQVLAVRGLRSLADLYTPRNLLALSLYRDRCKEVVDPRLRNSLLFVLTACCLKASRMMGYNSDGIGRIQKNGLIAQLIVKDINVFDFLEIAYGGIAAGYDEILASSSEEFGKCLFSTQSAIDLSTIPSNTVDYIFTDPPYGSRVQFWESNQVWEAWLGLDTAWQDNEVIVNRSRGLGEDHWRNLFQKSMGECHRVLKPGRWITLTYNDRETWPILQDVLLGIGFIPDGSDEPIAMETTAKSEKQLKGEDNTLRDLVISFRKPRPGEITSFIQLTGDEDQSTFGQKVRAILTDYLNAHPGATKDRILEEVVSRMVRKGQLEHYDLEEQLRTIAHEVKEPVKETLFENKDSNLFDTHEMGRWYLKDSEDRLDAAETEKEDQASSVLAQYIAKYLKVQPHEEGVHYGLLFEQYIYGVKDKPRRQLADWLPDYFFKTEAGTWRLPASKEEEQIKAKGRQSGLTRKIKRYVSCIEAGLPISSLPFAPSNSDLAEWVRHCKRAAFYEQGKLLYEKGGLNLDQLPEEAQVNVEEDYQVCVRSLSRETATKPAKGKRGRKSSQEELGI